VIRLKNLSTIKLDEKILYRFSKQIIDKSYHVEIIFVNKKKIKILNQKYRNLNQETDILTFTDEKKDSLHQIIICPEIAEKNSHQYNNNFEKELELLIFHGLQHIIGKHHL